MGSLGLLPFVCPVSPLLNPLDVLVPLKNTHQRGMGPQPTTIIKLPVNGRVRVRVPSGHINTSFE